MNSEEYLIVIEPTETGFSSYSPDLPGCITVGETVEQTRENMREAIELYIEELMEAGEDVPVPGKIGDQVDSIGVSVMHGGTYITFIPFETVHARSA